MHYIWHDKRLVKQKYEQKLLISHSVNLIKFKGNTK